MGQSNSVARREKQEQCLEEQNAFPKFKNSKRKKKYKNISKIFLLAKIDNSELLETLNKITSTP